jgi:hypothetical protein
MEVLAGLQASSTVLEHPLNYHSHALALESDLARQGLELDVVVAEELEVVERLLPNRTASPFALVVFTLMLKLLEVVPHEVY